MDYTSTPVRMDPRNTVTAASAQPAQGIANDVSSVLRGLVEAHSRLQEISGKLSPTPTNASLTEKSDIGGLVGAAEQACRLAGQVHETISDIERKLGFN